MKYMGSKRRVANKILPIILKHRKQGQWYLEPFMGGCNSLCEVGGNRIGNDYNEYVSAMWESLVNGWVPPQQITEQQFIHIKNNKEIYTKDLVGFVGVCCSFGSNWFGGYARNKRGTNYAMEGRKNLIIQVEKLKGSIFYSKSYDEINIPEKSIIYCDPPYQGTAQYKDKNFDHNKFWDWCRSKSKEGHIVYTSEYSAPDDFQCIWSEEIKTNMKAKNSVKSVEKLFIQKSQAHLHPELITNVTI